MRVKRYLSDISSKWNDYKVIIFDASTWSLNFAETSANSPSSHIVLS